jgi:hypothetical protein
LVLLGVGSSFCESIPIPNGSFETPATEFVDLRVEPWQKTPKPDWFVETPEQQWNQLVGVFKNTAPGSVDHIGNVVGNQALYLFSVPQAGLFQDLTNTFAAGQSYELIAGIVGGGGNMPEGATLSMSLYYRDSNGIPVEVSGAIITNTKALFPNTTNLVEFAVAAPALSATHSAIGKNIGLMLVSTAPPPGGGYWDLDNIRLEANAALPEVRNASFELPETDFVDTRVEGWTKLPKPEGFIENPQQQWDQLIGVFKNTPPGSADHIANVDGDQALFLFSIPSAGLFQEIGSTFEAGNSYRLDVGVVGGGGNMPEGASLLIGLYYRNALSNITTVAARSVLHSTNQFPNTTNLVDITMIIPAVRESDSWAGKEIGIIILSTVGPEMPGGYWDLDNVRLTTIRPQTPLTLRVARAGTDLRTSWQSESGKTYQLETSQDLRTWAPHGSAVAGSGSELFQLFPLANASHAFFRLAQTSP